jgi:hypothetical protein
MPSRRFQATRLLRGTRIFRRSSARMKSSISSNRTVYGTTKSRTPCVRHCRSLWVSSRLRSKKSAVVSMKVSNSPVVLFPMSLESQLQPRAIAVQFSPVPPIDCQPFATGLRKFLLEERFEEASADTLTDAFRAPRTPCVSVDHLAGVIQKSWLFLQRQSSFPLRLV